MLRTQKAKKLQKVKFKQYLAKMGVSERRDEFVPLKTAFVAPVRPGSDDLKNCKSVDDTVSGALTKTGIMRDYHKLSNGDREIVNHVASCTAPLHKGHYTYVSEGMNPAELGRKNQIL